MGDPTKASREKGEKILSTVISNLVIVILSKNGWHFWEMQVKIRHRLWKESEMECDVLIKKADWVVTMDEEFPNSIKSILS